MTATPGSSTAAPGSVGSSAMEAMRAKGAMVTVSASVGAAARKGACPRRPPRNRHANTVAWYRFVSHRSVRPDVDERSSICLASDSATRDGQTEPAAVRRVGRAHPRASRQPSPSPRRSACTSSAFGRRPPETLNPSVSVGNHVNLIVRPGRPPDPSCPGCFDSCARACPKVIRGRMSEGGGLEDYAFHGVRRPTRPAVGDLWTLGEGGHRVPFGAVLLCVWLRYVPGEPFW
ncbi:hypothetical protein SAMN05216276_1009197 [Streptosporangium subroseum]|uniref:4Fe-4S ferredoxin-type domain-containing protein n=1 Tax=Streptosporangium subroseum TaxID=106412 RepID=A0A239EMM6_9ACTN|nr:hypothetical protein SAMN05216276_1009197 [Streptosporangium subroseum]